MPIKRAANRRAPRAVSERPTGHPRRRCRREQLRAEPAQRRASELLSAAESAMSGSRCRRPHSWSRWAQVDAPSRVPPSRAVVVIKEPNGPQVAHMIMQAFPRAGRLSPARRAMWSTRSSRLQSGLMEERANVRGPRDRWKSVSTSSSRAPTSSCGLPRQRGRLSAGIGDRSGSSSTKSYEPVRLTRARDSRLARVGDRERRGRVHRGHALFRAIPDEKRGPKRLSARLNPASGRSAHCRGAGCRATHHRAQARRTRLRRLRPRW